MNNLTIPLKFDDLTAEQIRHLVDHTNLIYFCDDCQGYHLAIGHTDQEIITELMKVSV